jgi:hypothetical protein
MVNAADHAAAIFTDRTRDPEITDRMSRARAPQDFREQRAP